MSEERVSRSATFALLAQLVGGAMTAVLTIFLGRSLTATQFGAFTLALGVVGLAALLADAGISASTSRFLAERRDRPESAAAVFRTAVRLKLLVGVPTAGLLFALAGPLCDALSTPSAAWALRWCAIALFAQTLFNMCLGAFVALGKLRYNLTLATVESVSEVLATIPLVLLGATAAHAALGRAIGYAVGLAGALMLASRLIGRLRAGPGGRAADRSDVAPRRIVGYAGPLLLVEIAFRAFNSIDVLLIAGLLGGGAPVAAFGLPMRLTAFFEYPAAAVASAVSPRLTHRRSDDDVRLLAQSMRYLAIVQMLVTVPLLIWPEAVMHLLFGSRYPEAPEVLRALAPFVLLSGFAQLTTLAVNYLGEAWRRVPVAGVMLAVNVVIDVTLLKRIGIVAGAIGTSAAYAVWVPAHVWILRERGSLKLRPFLITMARTTLAGALMLGTLALLGTGVLSVPTMLLGAVLGTAVYFAALFAMRELGPRDIAEVRRLLARRVAR